MAIVESIMNLLTRQVTSSLAERLGASPSDVQMGLGSSVAALLAGIASRAGDSGFVSQVFQMVKTADTQDILDTLPNLASGAGASGILIWWSNPGSSNWNEADIAKIACPC